MQTVYVITMWSGGRPARKWKTLEEPTLLPQGTGVEFVSVATKLRAKVIGNISVEQYESGKEAIEYVPGEGFVADTEAEGGRTRTEHRSASEDNRQLF